LVLSFRPESMFIKDIVKKISDELNDTNLSDYNYKKGLVGIDSRVEEIMNLYMDMVSDDVRFIGICGMSGIGKTTLADVVFEKIRCEFQASSFLRDVKTRS
jgi:ABC-type glutathione transport system ATPase component